MLEIMALRAPVSPRLLAVTPERAAWLQRVAFALQVLLAARSGIPRITVVSPERAAASQRVAVTTQLAPRLPAAVGSAASEVMMLGSGEFVMLLLRGCLLLMLWLLMLLLLLRPRGRTGARPMRASSPRLGENSIISSLRNVLFVRPRRMLVLVLNSCPVFVHLRLLRSCVWLYILVRLLLLVVPSVSSSPPSVLRRYLAHKIQDTCPRELV